MSISSRACLKERWSWYSNSICFQKEDAKIAQLLRRHVSHFSTTNIGLRNRSNLGYLLRRWPMLFRLPDKNSVANDHLHAGKIHGTLPISSRAPTQRGTAVAYHRLMSTFPARKNQGKSGQCATPRIRPDSFAPSSPQPRSHPNIFKIKQLVGGEKLGIPQVWIILSILLHFS